MAGRQSLVNESRAAVTMSRGSFRGECVGTPFPLLKNPPQRMGSAFIADQLKLCQATLNASTCASGLLHYITLQIF